MALGGRSSSFKEARLQRQHGSDDKEEMRFQFIRYTRSFGRKRILISKNHGSGCQDDHHDDDDDAADLDLFSSPPHTPLKRLCSGRMRVGGAVMGGAEKSTLESLPQDVLIKILSWVDHEDLKQLVRVSKTFREATSIAKECYFSYKTPTKTKTKARPFRTWVDCGNPGAFDDGQAPNAPVRSRPSKSRLNGKNLTDISVALFASPKRKGLFMEAEMRSYSKEEAAAGVFVDEADHLM